MEMKCYKKLDDRYYRSKRIINIFRIFNNDSNNNNKEILFNLIDFYSDLVFSFYSSSNQIMFDDSSYISISKKETRYKLEEYFKDKNIKYCITNRLIKKNVSFLVLSSDILKDFIKEFALYSDQLFLRINRSTDDLVLFEIPGHTAIDYINKIDNYDSIITMSPSLFYFEVLSAVNNFDDFDNKMNIVASKYNINLIKVE